MLAILSVEFEEWLMAGAEPVAKALRARYRDWLEQAANPITDEEIATELEGEKGETSLVDGSMTVPMPGLGIRPAGVVGRGKRD